MVGSDCFGGGPQTALLHSDLGRNSSFFLNFFFFERERERQSASGGGAERGRQNPKQAPGSEPPAQSPTWGSNPGTMRS